MESSSGQRQCASVHMTLKIGIRADFPLGIECSIKKTHSPAVCPEMFSVQQGWGGRRLVWAELPPIPYNFRFTACKFT